MKTFEQKISYGLFKDAQQFLFKKTDKEISDLIYEFARQQDFAAYVFCCYQILTQDLWAWHHRANILLFWFFNYFSGSTAGAYSHIQHCLLKNPVNVELMEAQLYIYEIPHDPFDPVEIKKLCEHVLLLKPESEIAQQKIFDLRDVTEENTQKEYQENPEDGFCWFVVNGKFDEALKMTKVISEEKVFFLLNKISAEKNICAYSFLWNLLWINETSFLHVHAAEMFKKHFMPIVSNFNGHSDSGFGIIFFHTHRAAAFAPENIELQEKLLNLYEPGSESFDLAETKALAERVLAVKPESESARRVLKFLA
jgi:hypothetical protein